MKPGESLDVGLLAHKIACQLGFKGGSAAELIGDALKAFGDRRGEEERAKALATAADKIEQARDDGASMARSNLNAARAEADGLRAVLANVATWCHGGHGCFPQKGCGLCAPILRALAAAPSGDAKGTK